MKRCIALMVIWAATLLAGCPAALAHDMWLTVDKPELNKPLHVMVGYGHAFPQSEGTEKERLNPVYLLGPQGKLESRAGDKLDFLTASPLAKGSYVVVGGRSPQWYTKTPEGYKDALKNQVPGALSCLRSAKYAKAVVNLGGASDDVSKALGQTMEIVPLANPAAIKAGGDLPVQVLFEGKPLGNADVKATFADFTKDGSAYAFAAHTDKEGKTMVKVWHAGLWLVVAKHEVAFKDAAQCDKDMHAATLTFEIK
ncbi:MAG: DUF4198 domain-containing protein [Desulfarculus sp.]|nr:DUF4198 domain-containing protein [Desulfarculus sp.]